jgi:succinate dehydrogenase / fumarate reductase cytochrome b subunit
MNNQRFTNFNLMTIRYPFTAVISILHRLSGLFVFLLIPFLLWLLEEALSSESGFSHIQSTLMYPFNKFIIWLFLAALGYHFFAGVRHLLMDMGLGENLQHARLSGAIALIVSIIWSLFVGIWLW